MNGIGWITVAEAARLCGTDELRITLWMNGNHIAYALSLIHISEPTRPY